MRGFDGIWRSARSWADRFIPEEVVAAGPHVVARARVIVGLSPIAALVTVAPYAEQWLEARPGPATAEVTWPIAISFAIAPLILRRSRSANLAGAWMLLCAVIGTFIPAYVQQGLDSILMVWFLLIPMVASFILGARWAAAFTGLSALVLTAFWVLAGQPTGFPEALPTPESTAFRWLNLVLALAVISALAFFWEQSAERAARERAHLEAQVRRSQKLESVGMLAGGVAHDFNNILAAIAGHAQLLERSLAGSTSARHVQAIVDSSARGSLLVEQMLAYAGRTKPQERAVDIRAACVELSKLLRPGLHDNTRIVTELGESCPKVLGDRVQLQQLIMNLLTNASEALEGEPGRVWIRCGELPGSEAYPGLLAPRWSHDFLSFVEVRDEGCGIDEATLESIFDPFFTTKATGHGLGLAAVLGTVRSHGGDLIIESTPGQGTCIRVLFPPYEDALASVREAPPARELSVLAPSSQAAPAKRSILVVDDEDIILELAAEIISGGGYPVIKARDGEDAWQAFQEHRDSIALIISDRTMPGLDGLELIELVRTLDTEVPAILSTGYSHDTNPERLRELGITLVLRKPWTAADLLTTVRDLTSGSPLTAQADSGSTAAVPQSALPPPAQAPDAEVMAGKSQA